MKRCAKEMSIFSRFWVSNFLIFHFFHFFTFFNACNRPNRQGTPFNMDALATELRTARRQAFSGQYATARVYMDNIISSIRGRSGNAVIVRELREETKLMQQLTELVEGFRNKPSGKVPSESIWSRRGGDSGRRQVGKDGTFANPGERVKKDAMVWDPPTPPRKKDKHLPSWARRGDGPHADGRVSGRKNTGHVSGEPRTRISNHTKGEGAGGGGAARRRQRPAAGGRARNHHKRGVGSKARVSDEGKAKRKKAKRKLFVESEAASMLDAREIEMAEMIGKFSAVRNLEQSRTKATVDRARYA